MQAMDLRKKEKVLLLRNLRVQLDQIEQAPAIAKLPTPLALRESTEVIVLGSGPAGLFAAWRLTQAGLRPVLVERGHGPMAGGA